jgi:hypothetical protein
MTVDRIFFVYMVLVGIAAGAILVAAPQVQNFAIKPYFWVLIAVGLFDGGLYLLGRTTPEQNADDGRPPGPLRVRNCNSGGHSGDRRRAGAVFLALNQLPSSSTQ